VPDPAATTQQPAPATQTPPVQTAPQSAPATAVQRQSTAANAQLDALVAQSGDLVKQYAALQADYQPQLAKLQALAAEYDKILKLKSQAENNPDQLAQLEVERARLFASRTEQRAAMTSTRNELVRLSRANEDIGKQIAAIKANATNENAELNAALDAVDARQRATTTF
jgi:chromosome segregation ATPase